MPRPIRKTATISFRASPTLLQRLRAVAERESMDASDLARCILDHGLTRLETDIGLRGLEAGDAEARGA